MPQNYHITKLRQPATAREKGLHLLLFVGLLGYAWYLLAISNAQLLYTAQDFNPWLGTDAYWQQMVGHPGGWREWLGGWCTQYFYYPKLGATLLVGCWGLIAWLLLRAIGFVDFGQPWSSFLSWRCWQALLSWAIGSSASSRPATGSAPL